jgi:ABC-type nitrate/sulfonate/bicarbonate transport system ATPase subunit
VAHVARLRAEGLGKQFPPGSDGGEPVVALDGVELEVGAGEFVSIVGPSGCGKSTLLDLLAGLDPPTSGVVELDGVSGAPLLGRLGYMPQSDLLMPWRSVLDNAALGPQLAGVPLEEARRRARAELPRFGLSGFADAWPSQISGGMKQRAALLRTFLTGDDILLLDEPFAALDALTRQGMREWLLRVWEEDRKTIVFVTHDVGEAVFLSDRVYVMSARPGRVEMAVEVDLPRPRKIGTTTRLTRFTELEDLLGRPLMRSISEASGS